jgi:hypothetical protein
MVTIRVTITSPADLAGFMGLGGLVSQLPGFLEILVRTIVGIGVTEIAGGIWIRLASAGLNSATGSFERLPAEDNTDRHSCNCQEEHGESHKH